ncbi:MerR family transcriptional regulator [Magnetovibrio blakemorei]|uniref:HTH merR-type domain-containing protein n=1 Tax=Magnetovibrio blakemorei TaxID=28181 RepID=A0A1E5Q4B5_9PROT|nr:helix-turn-helix domain-containing protein [Magnetovibrio blakemorei]OEJ64954.1 hypothetical protein BEN30_00405 [Magnetovibrio blakemorei]
MSPKKNTAKDFTIGHMAAASGCNVQTVRYYEQIGILPAADRTAGNQRLYDQNHVDRARFVRRSRELGFSLDQIRQLLKLSDDPDQPCDEVDAIVLAHLDAVDEKIARLKQFRKELSRMASDCAGGKVSQCRIISALATTQPNKRA